MTTADVRDMLDLPTDGHPRPTKKQKTVEKRPEGITRELYALLGERAPPIAISDHGKYKERPKRAHKAQPWESVSFTNPARNDGLVLRHWRRKRDLGTHTTSGQADDGVSTDQESKPSPQESEYYYAKFNVKIDGPQYTEEQYNSQLRSDDWSKEETDYLVDLALDYDLRWVIVADRYDFQPAKTPKQEDEERAALIPAPKRRTMEDMKARYYDVAAKMLAIHRPISTMSAAEFDLHEKMSKFNPVQESQRKHLADALLSRTPDEIKDEEILLGELRRIVNNEDRLLTERKELRERLESPQSSGTTQMYQSSQGLGQLMQSLLSADKNKKRRSLLGPGENAASPAPGAAAGPSGATANGSTQKDATKDSHRESLSGPSGAAHKKGSTAAASAAAAAAAATTTANAPIERRALSPKEEERYGVSYHERLNPGPHFRHDKVAKLGAAKSNVQATKISTALTELDIPPRLVMPTAAVCAEYERLIQSIHSLLDVRKVSEKVEAEIKVAAAMKEERERRERAERGEPEPEPEAEKEKQSHTEAQGDKEHGNAKDPAKDPQPKQEHQDHDADVSMTDAPAPSSSSVPAANPSADVPSTTPTTTSPTSTAAPQTTDPTDRTAPAKANITAAAPPPTLAPASQAQAQAQAHKRSASVLSNASNKSANAGSSTGPGASTGPAAGVKRVKK
ncbi:MAG: hypothetical protein M1819_002002 [Sarea resinae]|nr:MAG: hypothetical protein M1819_002002 [Sarea resinae]